MTRAKDFLAARVIELRSVLTYLSVVLFFVLVGPVFMVYVALFRDLRRPYRWARCLIRLVMAVAGIRLVVEGREQIPEPPVMFVANHQSQLEPPLVFMLIPHDVRVFPKKELFRVPILGRLMRLAKFIPVDRQNPERARRDIVKAVDHLKEGVSYLIFPEGTRTRTGKVQRFKKGGFVLAVEAQVPVLPIAVAGAYELNPKGAWRIRPGQVTIRFLPPISTAGLTFEDRERLASETRRRILDALPPQYRPEESENARRE